MKLYNRQHYMALWLGRGFAETCGQAPLLVTDDLTILIWKLMTICSSDLATPRAPLKCQIFQDKFCEVVWNDEWLRHDWQGDWQPSFQGASTPADVIFKSVYKHRMKKGEQQPHHSTSGLWPLKLACALLLCHCYSAADVHPTACANETIAHFGSSTPTMAALLQAH